jgi:hypothetical protein
MTRSLDDILIGFLIFFILERIIKLFGTVVVEPWALEKTHSEKKTKNWVAAIDVVCLFVALILVIKYQKKIASIAKIA